ncbi:DUF1254 domain-containing protein [Acidovorax sp. Root217]|uniref:DUF1254 domain-containing protein n=1 Tax=Acidovorax sp. Root217 TaxID=1736492 RepID=UPI00070A580C|nr:DUF1254 domain-containing protein [Acidovorax sp. Root217]KRC23237.1 hypothetical protein ASE31_01030 [Acidovorax sp. Root217]
MNVTPAFSTTETPSHGNARAAVQQTLPLFEMMRMRAATTARRHPVLGFASDDRASHMRWVNHFTHTHRRIGPEDREVVSPNNDTVFSNAWLDLSRGPVLIDTPDMGERYWTLGLLDAWTNPFAYVGRRTTGNRRQRTLVHGPAWHGPVPDGVDNVIAAPGEDVWVIGRLLVDDHPDDLEQAAALQRGISTHRLDGGEAAFRVDTGLDGRAGHAPDAALYRATIDEALARNPVQMGESLCWPVDEGALADALPLVYEELRQKAQPHALGGGWALPVAVRTHWGADVAMRARVARNFIGALGIEEAMYPTAEVDADGALLNGSHAYELHFEPGAVPEVDAFWSLTLYRRSDCLLVANPAHRYSVGDRLPGLLRGADASLSIRIQAEDPGPAHNWLPAPPGEEFFLVLRLYQPRLRHREFRFPYPPLRRL